MLKKLKKMKTLNLLLHKVLCNLQMKINIVHGLVEQLVNNGKEIEFV